MNYEKIGQFVKERRKTLDLRQKELAELTGVSLRTIQNIESGKKVYLDTLRKVLNYYGYDIYIMTQDKSKIIEFNK